MPKKVLTRGRSWTARFAVLAVVFSLMAVALPASAHSVPIDTTVSCPATTPSAGFTDISAFDAQTQLAINCLKQFGITTGTTATTYSPNDIVLRWQMALFLVRQAADHGIAIPAAANQGFTDISALPQATQDAINQVAQLGISKGTTTTTFSPNDTVSRWQMALFLRRLAGLAGVTVTDDPAHNEFGDIAGFSAEIRQAINFLADGHIALGTGGSNFSPNDPVFRWSMALFLTRVLAADGVASVQVLVTVTPTDAVTLATGNARAYTATFKNANGTPYTGAIGLVLFQVTSGTIQYDNVPPPTATFEAVSDGLVIAGTTAEGFPGTDGIVTFLVRDIAGPTETIVPVAYEDSNNDNDPEITGNSAPTEPFGLGGFVTFAAGPLAECGPDGVLIVGDTVSAVDKAADRFEITAGICSIFYDSNDVLLIEGVAATLADFEAALSVGDIVDTNPYRTASGDQSTIDISTDNPEGLTVTSPASCGVEPCSAVTVDAATFTITGTAVAGYTVAIYTDSADNEVIDGTDAKVAEVTAAADGTWSAIVPLAQNQDNFFTANQRPTPASANGTPVNVPTITEGTNTAAQVASTSATNGGVLAVLDVGDTVTINFTENVNSPAVGNSVDFLENVGGTSVRLTCGTNATCVAVDADTIMLTVTGAPTVLNAGDNGTLSDPSVIQAIGGLLGSDGLAINVAGSPAANKTVTGY